MDVRDLSYWQYYRLIVARVAEMLLELIGDDDDDEFPEERHSQARQTPQTRREDPKRK